MSTLKSIKIVLLKHSWVFFRAKFHSKSVYSVEKKIVGISQYAYFSVADTCADHSAPTFNGCADLNKCHRCSSC
jgi:hypothetical protein